MDKFQTFEQCCAALGLDPASCLPEVSKFPAQHQESITALAKLMIISEAVNEGWKPNWNDLDDYKYLPWFDMEVEKRNPSGFRFVGSICVRTGSYSAGGSRLCFKSRDISDFVGKHYEDLWKAAMVFPG
jgi:hypothetical protein